jgi:hypothetical protein
MIGTVGIDEAADDISASINAIGCGRRGVRNINFYEAKVSGRQQRAEGYAEQGHFDESLHLDTPVAAGRPASRIRGERLLRPTDKAPISPVS